MQSVALVLGAACPIGAALLKRGRLDRYGRVVLCDKASRLHIVRALLKMTAHPSEGTIVAPLDPRKPFAGLDPRRTPFDGCDKVDIFHLAQSRDRSMSASEIRAHNGLVLERVLSIAYKFSQQVTAVVVTDIGLVGDYPGRFSENWVDVGQTPFDEVDRSSLEAELACQKETALSIVRARVGLVLDPVGIPSSLGYWRPLSETFVGFSRVLRSVPSLFALPIAAAKGALAPVTPADFAADVLLAAVGRPPARGAVHLVVDPPPTIAEMLDITSRCIGGARLKPSLPVDKLALLGRIPGFKEMARRNADQLASWWTPHRYCLSRNEVDTALMRRLVPDGVSVPTWQSLRALVL